MPHFSDAKKWVLMMNSEWKYPNIPGIDTFAGKIMHTARWDPAYDLTGKTVAVLGGGSSAVQTIPSIQPSKSSPTGDET